MRFQPDYDHRADGVEYGGNESGCSERFIDEWAGVARFCPDLGKVGEWIVWGVEPGVWTIDRSGNFVKGLCKETCARQEVAHEAVGSFVRSGFIRNVLNLVQPDLMVGIDEFDADPWILNTKFGVCNLRTGQLRDWAVGEKFFLQTAVAPRFDEECPLWESHVKTMAANTPDPEGVARYLQRLVGISLIGDQDLKPHIAPVLCSEGRTGKGSFVDTLRLALGSYAGQASAKLLTASESDHTTEQAGLEGLRMVTCEEVLHLNPSLFKALTGGGKLRARKMRADDREFDKTWTMWLVNNRPVKWRDGDRTSAGLWSRVPTILMGAPISEGERDEMWSKRLEEEAGAILAWAIQGSIDWLADGGGMAGLKTPQCVRDATMDRKEDADALGTFLEEHYEACDGWGATASSFMKRYTLWCKDTGEAPSGGRNSVYAELRERFNLKVDKGTGGQVRIYGMKEKPISLGMMAEGVSADWENSLN